MSKVQTLRVFVKQRLTAAAEEIFELFERTIAEYEEELGRHRKLLDAVFKPQVQLHRADVQLLLVSEEEVPPEQQEWSSSLDQEDPPELPHIKEEPEELWTSQEREQLQVSVKREEDDEENKQLHQRQTEENITAKTEADVEDCGGPEPACDFDPVTHDTTSHSSEPESGDRCDREETRKPRWCLNRQQNDNITVSDVERKAGKKSNGSSQRAANCGRKRRLQDPSGVQTGTKIFCCSVCGKKYPRKKSFIIHMRLHTEGKRFSCSVCGTRFAQRSNLNAHLKVHTGEKPFACSVCKTRFSRRNNLDQHMRTHTGEKPFGCSVCGKTFGQKTHLRRHLTLHTGEKPFSCSVCGKGFTERFQMKNHKCVGESSRNK
ncbi:uncharacterized protein [Pagrus major]|uniref:uncharacterized protein isoform X2 n=1 Tax=Pagrus major TaxID=143350 RepID=UPI003CC85993